jgi:autotransporter-associated beta strand protein
LAVIEPQRQVLQSSGALIMDAKANSCFFLLFFLTKNIHQILAITMYMSKLSKHTLSAISRSLFGIALSAAILLVFVARAPAQTWSPGDGYNAVTLGSGSFFTTDNSYTQALSSNAASVEMWVNFSASAQADMAIGQAFDTLFNEGIVLYADWNGSNGYDLNMVGIGAFGGDIQTVTNPTTMLPGQWYHIVGEYDANGLASYVNGTATTGNWGGGGGPTANKTFNANTWGSSALTGLPSFEGLTTGFRIWDGNIGAPTEANSAVNASPNYTGTLDANFQVGTNGNTTALVGSPAGGDLTLTGSAQYAKYGTGTVTVTSDSYFLDTIDAGTLQIGDGNTTGALTTDVVNNGALSFNRSDALTHSYAISGAGAVNHDGSGTLTLSGTNTYTGDTKVNAGTLNIAGSLTSDVIVAAGATVAGSGSSTGSLSGAGSVGPGNSPGIIAFASLDASAGMSFDFEFTAADPAYSNASSSANDVLRLTDGTTPFTEALTSSSMVNIYLNVETLDGPYTGGLFTDLQSDFLALIQDATFTYYLKDAGGVILYDGLNYRDVSDLGWTLSTVPTTADFAGGTINGQVLQAVVPEPSSYAFITALSCLALLAHRRRR